MPFQYKTINKSVAKGESFTNLLKHVRGNAFQSAVKFGNQVRDVLEAQIEDPNEFVARLGTTLADLSRLGYQDILDVSTQKKLGKRLGQLASALSITDTVELDHKTMAPINQQISLLIIDMVDAIEKAELVMNAVGKKQALADLPDNYQAIGGNKRQGISEPLIIKALRGLKEVVNELREIRAFGEAIERVFNANLNLTPKKLNEAYETLIKDGVLDITEIKEKDIGFNSKKLINLQVEFASKHQQQSKWQKVQGALRTSSLLGKNIDLEGDMKQMAETARDIILRNKPTTITGSKSIEEELGKHITDAFKGKRRPRYKSKSSKTTKKKIVDRPAPKGKSAAKAKSNALKAQQAVLAARAIKSGKNKTESGSIQKELNKLKTLINRRLGAEVRRNMGRPALTNRSGTFSNSVRLLSLREGPNSIIGEYTYMKTGGGTPPRSGQPGVYQTFEGQGKNIWPRGYNPKPLIAKSIRNLAQQQISNRFTLRRA